MDWKVTKKPQKIAKTIEENPENMANPYINQGDHFIFGSKPYPNSRNLDKPNLIPYLPKMKIKTDSINSAYSFTTMFEAIINEIMSEITEIHPEGLGNLFIKWVNGIENTQKQIINSEEFLKLKSGMVSLVNDNMIVLSLYSQKIILNCAEKNICTELSEIKSCKVLGKLNFSSFIKAFNAVIKNYSYPITSDTES